jgi:glutamate dehydrogenase/leucine dehydrogenase
VLGAIRAALWALDGSDDLDGRSVGVLGLGKVGAPLAEWLVESGASVVGYDPFAVGVEGIAHAASQADLLGRELDVLAPCALGGLIDAELAAALRCRIVCGAANNPLADAAAATTLADRGILYVPDFLANCGGLVRADAERRGAGTEEVERALADAGERTRAILAEAQQGGEPPVVVAERHASARIEAAAAVAAAA